MSNTNNILSKTPGYEKKSLVATTTTNEPRKAETNVWDSGGDHYPADFTIDENQDHTIYKRNDVEQYLNNGDDQDELGEVPAELKLEEFNENDPDMDPLEWSARKILPIPQVYYWQTGSMTRCAECIGEVIADFTGLTGSQYDYVTSTMTPEEWETSKRNLQVRSDSQRSLGRNRELKPSALNRGGEFELSVPSSNRMSDDIELV